MNLMTGLLSMLVIVVWDTGLGCATPGVSGKDLG